jgi:Family of unknown function (DUF6492)
MTAALPFSLVLPVRLTPKRHEREYLTQLLLPSLERFLDAQARLIVVAPDGQLATVRELFSRLTRHSVVCLADSAVVPDVPADVKGWRRQQMIKLMAAKLVDTPHYITMDADVFLLRPVTPETLVRDGRLVTNLAPASRQAEWWRASADLLGVAPPPDDATTISVTPAILVTDEVRRLIEAVRSRHGGRPFEAVLGESRFTEYTLYWCHLLSRGLHDTLYVTSGPGLFSALWQFDMEGDLQAQFLAYVRANPSAFALVQSSNKLRPAQFLPPGWDIRHWQPPQAGARPA